MDVDELPVSVSWVGKLQLWLSRKVGSYMTSVVYVVGVCALAQIGIQVVHLIFRQRQRPPQRKMNQHSRNMEFRNPSVDLPAESMTSLNGTVADPAAESEVVTEMLKRATARMAESGDRHLTMEHLVLELATQPRFKEILTCCEGLEVDEVKKAVRKSRIMYNRGDPSAEPNVMEPVPTALSKYSRDLTAAARAGELDPVVGRNDELRRMINILSRRTKNNPILLGEPGVGKTAVVEGLTLRVAAGDVPANLRGITIAALDMGMLMAGAMMPGEFEERMRGLLKELTAEGGKFVLFIDDIHSVTGPNAQMGGGVMDASLLLKPLLSRGELRVIGATTPDKFRRFIEKDPGLERRFQSVTIAAPSVASTVSILRGLRLRYERHHSVRITDAALVAAASLSDRYVTDRYLPDKAIDLIDEAAARAKLELDLKPELTDRLERQRAELEAERRALLRHSSGGGRHLATALEALDSALVDVRSRLEGVLSGSVGVRKEVQELADVQDELDRLKDDEACEGEEPSTVKERADKIGKLEAKLRILLQSCSSSSPPRDPRLGVSEADVAAVISDWTGVPVAKLVEGEGDKVLALAEDLHCRVVGQEEAVEAVAEAIQRSRAGMKDPNGPIASFLFLGPTGVGKTELAKALAAHLFNSEDAMVRLDMSEYMEKHAVSKLIGAPPGYVGFDEGGQLTEAVRRRPYCVVLFDEVEKAHVDVFNLLLQLLDDGRVTDSQGRTVSFKNAIIIMTSNLGSGEMYRRAATRAGKTNTAAAARSLVEEVREMVMEEVRKHFQPEFVNRIDEFIVFEPLSPEQITSIVRMRVKGVISRMAEKKIKLTLSDDAISHISRVGFDPVFGARPVKRVITRELETPLAKVLLAGIVREEDAIVVDTANAGTTPSTEYLVLKKPDGSLLVNMGLAAGSSSGAALKEEKAEESSQANGAAPHKGKGKGPVLPSRTAKAPRFDPVAKLSSLAREGVDISEDGSEANRDDFSLPTKSN